jgi:hypothetical protein
MVIIDTNSANERFTDLKHTQIGFLPGSREMDSKFNGVSIRANITSVDLNNQVFKSLFNFEPIGNVAVQFIEGKSDPIFHRPVNAITIILAGKMLSFPAYLPMAPTTIDIPISEGNINRYPFDNFITDFQIYASTTGSANLTDIPVAFSVVGAIQSFRTKILITDDSGLNIFVKSTRSFTVMFFSLFILVSMYVLAFVVFTLAVTLWFRERTVEPATIGVAGSLLFALPAIRNTQPGVPPIGCTLDLVGFFWCMFLVMVSTALLMINYILKYQRVKPKTPNFQV